MFFCIVFCIALSYVYVFLGGRDKHWNDWISFLVEIICIGTQVTLTVIWQTAENKLDSKTLDTVGWWVSSKLLLNCVWLAIVRWTTVGPSQGKLFSLQWEVFLLVWVKLTVASWAARLMCERLLSMLMCTHSLMLQSAVSVLLKYVCAVFCCSRSQGENM